MLYIPQKIQNIINTLTANGFEAYIVGGCVRDMLLGKEPHDFDVTTSATPNEIISLFEKTVPTGIKHGTVTVISNGEPIEVTTFRTDGVYSDCRRPDSVIFVRSLKEDLARRDFTINALAYNENVGLQDFFCGKQDLENRVLRAVGKAECRFKEDALRILRLFRFSSVLGFEIEKETLESAVKSANLLESISHERIFTELIKTVCGQNPSAMLPLIESGAIEFLGVKKSPNFTKIAKLNNNENLAFFTFLYLSDCDVEKTLCMLKCSNRLKLYCNKLATLLQMPVAVNKQQLKEMLNKASPEIVSDYLLLLKEVFEKNTKELEKMLKEIIDFKEPYKISDLEINGKELEKIGITGVKLGDTLERLRQAVTECPFLNIKSKLIEKAKEINS